MSRHNILFLLLGGFFHLLLLSGIATEPMPVTSYVVLDSFVIYLTIYVLLGILAWRFHCTGNEKWGIACTIFIPIFLVPIYLFYISSGGILSVVGMITALFQAKYLLWCFPRGYGNAVKYESEVFINLVLLAGIGCVTIFFFMAGYQLFTDSYQCFLAWVFAFFSFGIGAVLEIQRFQNSKKYQVVAEDVLLILFLIALTSNLWLSNWSLTLDLLLIRQVLLAGRFWYSKRGGAELRSYLYVHPGQLLVFSFMGMIIVGAILLALPISTIATGGLNSLDALFTATSATCVTGLVVLDTGLDFTMFGQIVILILIQVGGLGFMTISTFFALLLGRSIGLKGEFAISSLVGEERTGVGLRLLKFIMILTFSIEFIGASILFGLFYFHDGLPFGQSIYYAVFHSISAFCNGGFALFSDSLCSFSKGIWVPLVISILIVLGGLGFAVQLALGRLFRRGKRLDANVKLVLLTTTILLLGGFVFFWFGEFGDANMGGSELERVANSWFQSVTARTAGFNSVNLGKMGTASIFIMLILMFIGAAPGSTGGGVKVSTVAVLVLVIRSVFSGKKEVVYDSRQIDQSTIFKAIAIMVMSGLILSIAIVVLLLSESFPAKDIIFEAVSAFATVGLSLGITAKLSAIGKITIIVLMFAGRIGMLTLVVMLRPRRQVAIAYPSAKIMIA